MDKTCSRCGHVGDVADFIKQRPQRRPVCRTCDNREQRESRYKRLGKRRAVGENETYTCTDCHQVFDRVVTPGKPRLICDLCVSARYRASARPKYRDYDLKKKYGITVAEYDAMLAAQGGGCAICSVPQMEGRLRHAVDHDHGCCAGQAKTCGKCIRGLLCTACNTALGAYEKHGYMPADFRRYIDSYRLRTVA